MLHKSSCYTTIAASDLDRARRWYAEKLGMEPERQERGDLIYTTADGTGFMVYESQFAGTNQATTMAWQVADFDAEVADLRDRGVTFEDYDFPGMKTENGVLTMPDGSRGAWFKDSEGNILAVSDGA